MEAEAPTKEHAWLQQLVGEWDYEGKSSMGPGQPDSEFKGTESVRKIGDFWVLAEGKGEMPDGDTMTSILTIGYDGTAKRFVGTWLGSMMSRLWVYDMSLDETGKILTMQSDGPSFSGEGTSTYQDIIEIEGDGRRILRAQVKGEDGSWQEFMRTHYRRRD